MKSRPCASALAATTAALTELKYSRFSAAESSGRSVAGAAGAVDAGTDALGDCEAVGGVDPPNVQPASASTVAVVTRASAAVVPIRRAMLPLTAVSTARAESMRSTRLERPAPDQSLADSA